MKKEYMKCILWFSIFLLGIIFTTSAIFLQALPNSSKSALLLFSICFVIIGLIALAVHYRKYIKIKSLANHTTPVIAHWTYDMSSSSTLKNLLSEQKNNTISTAILSLILGIIFCLVFAYSGGIHVLYIGYIFILLTMLGFIVAIRIILTYYTEAAKGTTEVIFGEDCIYFMEQLYTLQKSIYFLENIIITKEEENILQFIYGQYDVDDSPACIVCIPIPENKLQVAEYLRKYYLDLIAYE